MSRAPAADQALAILTLLSHQVEALPAARISAALDLPRSTTYRLLESLVENGFVAYREGSQSFGLGLQAYAIGSAYQRQTPLQRIARPYVQQLTDDTGENAHLTVLRGPDVYYLIEERAPQRARLVTDVGIRLPATLTASGLALLAALTPAQVRAIIPTADLLVQRDGRGVATLGALRQELADTRTRGYAQEDGLITPGLSSVAQAIRDPTGHPVAAVAVTYRAGIDRRRHQQLVSAVARTATLLSARLAA